MSDGVFVHVLALGLAPEWRRRHDAERAADFASFRDAEGCAAADDVRSLLYSSVGLEPGVDVVLWRTADSVDALEAASARLLRSELGGWLTVRNSFVGRTGGSQYVAKPTDQETGLLEGDRGRYVIVYPFTKASEWYLLSRETRQGVMNEHMRVGRAYPTVRQALAYSFGLDDQDFIVAYETDDLPAFGELVRELRGTESRRTTVSDAPILLAIRRSLDELGALIGAVS